MPLKVTWFSPVKMSWNTTFGFTSWIAISDFYLWYCNNCNNVEIKRCFCKENIGTIQKLFISNIITSFISNFLSINDFSIHNYVYKYKIEYVTEQDKHTSICAHFKNPLPTQLNNYLTIEFSQLISVSQKLLLSCHDIFKCSFNVTPELSTKTWKFIKTRVFLRETSGTDDNSWIVFQRLK